MRKVNPYHAGYKFQLMTLKNKQTKKKGFDISCKLQYLHETSKPISGKNKKKYNILSAEFAQNVVKTDNSSPVNL